MNKKTIDEVSQEIIEDLNKAGMFGATGAGGAIAASEDKKPLEKITQSMKSPLLAKEITNYLKRAHVARKLRGAKTKANMRQNLTPQQIAQQFVDKAEEVYTLKSLAKNDTMVSMYKSGSIRLDFGSDVPDKIKKAALKWAERRGLNPVEASMNKSSKPAPSYFVYNQEYDLVDECLKRFKWTVGE